MNENTKITLTIGQLKRLVKESVTKPVYESKANGGDGIFHAQGLVKIGFELRKDVDVYDLNDKKARFYALDGGDTGIVYSRKGKVTTLIPYSVDRGVDDKDRSHAISGNYDEIMDQLDDLVRYVRKM